MTEYLLLLYPTALLIMTFCGCKIAEKGSFSEECLSREQSKNIQAIVCLFIVLHHLTQMISGYGDIYRGPITILSNMGILFTSVFFFFSGFGLIVSVKSKETYLKNFLIHRLSTILVPFFIANAIAVLVRIYYRHIPMTGKQIMQCVSGYVLINGNGWYIVEILFLYIAFYLLFRLIKNKGIAAFLLSVFTIFLIYAGYKNGHDNSTLGDHWLKGEWWYNSTAVFIMGIAVGFFKDKVIEFAKKHYSMLTAGAAVLFFISFYYEERIRKMYGYYRSYVEVLGMDGKLLTLISQIVICLLFTALILLINMKISIGNKAIAWISTITMEIFLLHGLFINNIQDLSRRNEFVAYAIVIICALAVSVPVHFVNSKIISLINSFEEKGRKKEFLRSLERDLVREKKEKKLKKLGYIALTVAVLAVSAYYIRTFVMLPMECKKELKSIEDADINDVVQFGRYDTAPGKIGKERLEWIVKKKENGMVMLVCLYGIDGSSYNHKYEQVSWQESDLYQLMNNEMYESIFSNSEKEHIVDNPETNEKLSLLSVNEAQELFSDDVSRQLGLTDYAIQNGVNVNSASKINEWDYKDYRSSWWWLKGEKDITAPIVTPEGQIETDQKYVNKPNGAIRPVVWVRIQE